MDVSRVIMMLFLVALSHKVSAFASPLLPSDDDSVVVVKRTGESAALSCPYQPTDSCLIWTHHGVDGRDIEVNECGSEIQHERYRDRFSEQSNETASTLTITNITADDAGKYECQDPSVDTSLASSFSSTQLIVIDESPTCSKTTHEELGKSNDNRGKCHKLGKIELSCRITLHGSPNLSRCSILEWREAGKEGSLQSECKVVNKTVISTLTLDSKSHTNDSSYICVATSSASGSLYSCETYIIPSFSTGCETDSPVLPTSGEPKIMAPVNYSQLSTSSSPSSSSSSSSSSFTTMSFWLLFSLPVLRLFLHLHSL